MATDFPDFNLDFLYDAPYGAYAMSLDQTIRFWNSGAEQILGHRAENVLGRHCYEVLQNLNANSPAEVCIKGCPSLGAAREGHTGTVFQMRMLCASGERKLVTLTPIVIPTEDSSQLMLVHLFHGQNNEALATRAAYAVEGVLAGSSSPRRKAGQEKDNPLTDRELEVLGLMAAGMSNRDISKQLGVSYHTVRNHLSSIRSKLSVKRRNDAARIGRMLGLGNTP